MKIGVIILCRYDSTRLYGKALKNIHGKPILEWIHKFVGKSKNIDSIVIATSDHSSDDNIAEYCINKNLNIFRGSKQNVAKRFLDCANYNKLDYAFRINGDNLFVQPEIVNQMINIVDQKEYDFISNVEGRTFPYGMSVELLKISFFNNLYKKFKYMRHFEHVTLYLYENLNEGNRKNIENNNWQYLPGVHLAIDTLEDFKKAEKIFDHANGDYAKINLSFLNQLIKTGVLN